MSKSIKSIKNN